MFYVHEFWYKTTHKVLETAAAAEKERRVENAVVIFVHAEAEDEEQKSGVLRKLVKNIKWLAGKFDTKNVVLHSFAHLSDSKSSPLFAESILIEAQKRLARVGYTVDVSPFGYLNEFKIHVSGESLGRVFKSF